MSKRDWQISINFNTLERSQINFLLELMGVSTPQELIRDLIKDRFRAGNSASAANGRLSSGRGPGRPPKVGREKLREQRIAELMAMDDVALLEWLRLNDFAPVDIMLADHPGVVVEHRIRTDEAGRRFYYVRHRNFQTNEISYHADLLDMNELISELKKEKKL